MTFLLCDPGWCVHKSDVQNKWDDNTHTHTHTIQALRCGGTQPYQFMCGHPYSKSKDQSGKVANPARGRLNREK